MGNHAMGLFVHVEYFYFDLQYPGTSIISILAMEDLDKAIHIKSDDSQMSHYGDGGLFHIPGMYTLPQRVINNL